MPSTSRRAISTSRELTPTSLRLLEGTSRSSVSLNSLGYRSVFMRMTCLIRNEGSHILARPDDHIGDADFSGLRQRFPEKRVPLVTPFVRRQIVWGFVIHRPDLVSIHETENIDGLGCFDVGAFEIFFGQDDIPVLSHTHSL